jgi:hypothetical protein
VSGSLLTKKFYLLLQVTADIYIKYHSILGHIVSRVSGYWLDDREMEVRSPAKAELFFL